MKPSDARATVSLTEAAELLGVGRATAYNAAKSGNFPVPVLRVGSRYVVPTRPLLQVLGVSEEVTA